jgi:diadenosine tetraphosphatase ApaH/serine/threonine PP2A family protein phosphatase
MSRLAILTDLHANREAVEAVLTHARAQQVDRFALLGDFVGYGADPAWVVDKVRTLVAEGAIAVQGNHDLAVVRGPAATMRQEARQVIEWTRERLDPSHLEFLEKLPLSHGESGQDGLLFVHANAFAPAGWEYIDSPAAARRSMQATRCRITFCGHMHDPMLYHQSLLGKVGEFVPVAEVPIPLLMVRRWLVVPGSVGQPRDGNPAAAYAIFDQSQAELTFWRVPYDHDRAGDKIRTAGLPQRLAGRLVDGQ